VVTPTKNRCSTNPRGDEKTQPRRQKRKARKPRLTPLKSKRSVHVRFKTHVIFPNSVEGVDQTDLDSTASRRSMATTNIFTHTTDVKQSRVVGKISQFDSVVAHERMAAELTTRRPRSLRWRRSRPAVARSPVRSFPPDFE
jgi:hypothetical protein